MNEILLDKNGWVLTWEPTPHDGPPMLVLQTPRGGKYIGEAIIDAIANLEDYYDRLEAAKKAAKEAVVAHGRILEKLDPDVLKKKKEEKKK